MTTVKGVLIIIIACCFFPLYSYAFDDGDFQYWSTWGASYKIHDDWKITAEEELRYGDDAGHFYYHYTDMGVVYSGLTDWLDIGMNYRQIFEEKKDEWKYENRPHVNVTLRWKRYGVSLSDRNRIEYRDKEDSNDTWRYRNKLTVKFPITVMSFEIGPYVADEIYIDFDKEELTRNRLFGGMSIPLIKHVTADVYYLWQSSEKNKEWIDWHMLGTKLKVSF